MASSADIGEGTLTLIEEGRPGWQDRLTRRSLHAKEAVQTTARPGTRDLGTLPQRPLAPGLIDNQHSRRLRNVTRLGRTRRAEQAVPLSRSRAVSRGAICRPQSSALAGGLPGAAVERSGPRGRRSGSQVDGPPMRLPPLLLDQKGSHSVAAETARRPCGSDGGPAIIAEVGPCAGRDGQPEVAP